MCKETKVTESELEILKVIWKLNKSTTSEIVSELTKKHLGVQEQYKR